eukprot:6459488-Amphidinium_carterae.1
MAYGCAASLAILASLCIPCLKLVQFMEFDDDLGLELVLPVLESISASSPSFNSSWLWLSSSSVVAESHSQSANEVPDGHISCVPYYPSYYSYYGAYSCSYQS